MMPIKRWLLLGGTTLLLVLLAVLWLQGPSSDDSAAVSQESAALPPDAYPVELQWRVGSSQQYQLQFDSSMQMNSTAASTTQAMRVQMDVVLDMLTLEASHDTALVGMRLSSVELQVAGNSDPETNRALAVPFRVRYVSGGFPVAFEFPAGVTAQHRSMLENLVRTFQVTMHEGETWVMQEANASGAYEASYRRTAPSLVVKTKRHFSALSSSAMLAGADIASTEEFRLDAQRDWIVAMSVDETLQSTGQGGPAIEISNHATLELRPTAQAAWSPDTWDFVAAAAPPLAQVRKRPAIPSISPQQARQQILAAVPALDTASEGRSVLIYRLRDLLRVDGALPAVLLETMKTQQLSDRTRADLYLALELAGTEQAQAALASVVLDTTWSTLDAMRAIVALGGVDQPSPDTVQVLWETALNSSSSDDRSQLASTATFALGSLGKTMNATEDPDYSSLRADLLGGALSGAGSERANFVHAVGNTRDASLATDIVGLLDDAEPAVRRAAAQSLGMLGTNQAADELMSRFNQEDNSVVRGTIAESLVTWTEPSAPAVATIRAAVHAEPDENTRYNMARFLGANLEKFPENRPVLQDLLRTEQSKRIRQSVAEALATPR